MSQKGLAGFQSIRTKEMPIREWRIAQSKFPFGRPLYPWALKVKLSEAWAEPVLLGASYAPGLSRPLHKARIERPNISQLDGSRQREAEARDVSHNDRG